MPWIFNINIIIEYTYMLMADVNIIYFSLFVVPITYHKIAIIATQSILNFNLSAALLVIFKGITTCGEFN